MLQITYCGAIALTDPTVKFLFSYTGREWDGDASLYYYRARWYDAKIGRFVLEDPMGFAAGDSNLNRYVGNSSLNATDPSGNWSVEAHLAFLTAMFGDIYTSEQIFQMAAAGAAMDGLAYTFKSLNPQHYMIAPGSNAQEAVLAADEFIKKQIMLAREQLKIANNMTLEAAEREKAEQAVRGALAAMMHTIMDSTSPAHADPNGWPLAWVGANTALHSPNDKVGIERSIDITDEIMRDTLARMMAAYASVQNTTLPPYTFPAPGM